MELMEVFKRAAFDVLRDNKGCDCLTSMLKIGQNGMRKNVQNVLFKLTIRI